MSYAGVENNLQQAQLPIGSVLEEELHEKRAMFRDFLTSRVSTHIKNLLILSIGSLGRGKRVHQSN
jgi:hypothetical protein